MKVIPLDADPHVAVRVLLPWYAANRIDADEAAQVEAHLAGCPGCRAELELERRLQAAQPLSVATGDVDRGWANMRKLIRSSSPRVQSAAPWLRWVVAAQFAIIAALFLLFVLPPAADYRTLGTQGAGAAANAVVMFKPGATEQEIRSALRVAGARLVDGPTATNAYLVSVPVEGHAEAIARLRAQPTILLAESLDAKPRP